MSSVELVQAPFDIVHRNVAEVPTTKDVIPELADPGTVTIAVPDNTDQLPEPITGIFAASVPEVVLQRF